MTPTGKMIMQRKAGTVLMAAMLSFALVASQDADAKRLGGGRSFGKQSNNMTQSAPAPQGAPAAAPKRSAAQQTPANVANPAAAAAAAPKRNWTGMVGGLAAGLGLGMLLSHLGLGEGLASMLSTILMIALAGFVIMWLVRRFRGGSAARPALAGAGLAGAAGGSGGGAFNQTGAFRQAEPQASAWSPAPPTAAAAWAANDQSVTPVADTKASIPADFDTVSFLRHAKVYFVRLQAAWDAGNLDDIREFTTPEMFAEIKMDLGERGATGNKTDVVTIDAELLGIEQSPVEYVVSVRFAGMIREQENVAAQPFAEIWHLSKPVAGQGGWTLAGIQQQQ